MMIPVWSTLDKEVVHEHLKIVAVMGQDGHPMVSGIDELVVVRLLDIPGLERRGSRTSLRPNQVGYQHMHIFIQIEVDKELSH
jgi:hypothetical protein